MVEGLRLNLQHILNHESNFKLLLVMAYVLHVLKLNEIILL